MAEAMFQNREEVPVIPIYRDPVHDFGFFAYDPAAVKFMEVTEIPLRPEEAVVGTDIRVCGVRATMCMRPAARLGRSCGG